MTAIAGPVTTHPSVAASSLPGNQDNSAVFLTTPSTAPTAPTSSSTGFVPRNPITGAADYSGLTTPQAPVGTMNAVISNPSKNAPKVPPPVVLTSDAADKDLENIKTQTGQVATDTAAHKAAMASTPPVTPTKPTATDTQATAPTATGDSIDDKINNVLSGLAGNNSTIDSDAATSLAPLNTQATDLQAERDAASVTAINQLNSIATGVYPLTPSESSLLDSTKQMYLATIQGQNMANDAATGQMTELAASLGINTSAPSQAIGLIHQTISEGADKVADLNGKMAQSLATLSQGFQKDDFDMVKTSWDETAKNFDDRLKTISDMQTAITAAVKQQKSDLMDTAKLTLSTMMGSAKFTYQQKQDAIDNAFKAKQISETQRHDLANEATANNKSNGGDFTQTQLNKGAANAAVDATEFANYPADVKNYYINNPTQAKAFNALLSDLNADKVSPKDVADTISGSGLPDDVQQWMYQKAGVDENGNSSNGEQDPNSISGALGQVKAFAGLEGQGYDDLKSWIGIE